MSEIRRYVPRNGIGMDGISCANIRRYQFIHNAPGVAQLNAFLRRRLMRFTHQVGRRRLWHPGVWRWNERILVIGESIAFVSSTVALVAETPHWHGTIWFLMTTTIVDSASLLWYAGDTVSAGERPQTPASIQNIRRVVQGVMIEDAGAVVDWEHPDDQRSIPLGIE